MKRRKLLSTAALAVPAAAGLPMLARAAGGKTLKIGYQKFSAALLLLKARGWLEKNLAPLGYDVAWAEFPSGPPMLEALGAGAINLAITGETPPVFSQASGTPVVYVAYSGPHPHEEAILVKAASAITRVADLKGQRVAVAKGSNAHYLLVAAVKKAGLAFGDITPIYLAPSDARAAFETGAVDAWAIWDPFYASLQAATPVRVLSDAQNVVPNNSFYLSRRDFATQNAAVLHTVIAQLQAIEAWVPGHEPEVAAEISASIGVPAPVLLTSFRRATFGVRPVTPAELNDQQKIADLFYQLNLIPAPINVADAAWS